MGNSESQMQCRDSGYGCPGRKAKPVYLKRLKDLWDKRPGCHNRFPWEKGQYSASNTLLIDTEPHVSLLNPVNTAIFPEPFKNPNPEDAYLGPNGELQRFLEGLSSGDIDVPTYVKEHRIGRPPITPSHPNWAFYQKVVHRYRSNSNTE
ncbi:unnamed protein product [Cuscuta europaea]|uniref:Uncharacterized protein n=1 Tax=Cuscuta europaea TaxID=41803 RepID=A0A9P0ZZT6_CUSEU|nr:unnamed protein product [Cuscuta europaea]